MVTDIITVSGAEGQETALRQAEKTAVYQELSPKGALHLRLLTEEMMGLMRTVTGAPDAQFWIENEDGEYRLHLKVETLLSTEKKEKLIAASTTGRNESARGIMGRLRSFFDWGGDEDSLAAYGGPLGMPDMFEGSSSPMLDWEWSMTRYERALQAGAEQGDARAREAWDELEMSVVKHVADEIKVYIRSNSAEMVILKKLA